MSKKKKPFNINNIFEDPKKDIMCVGKKQYETYGLANYAATIEMQKRRAKNLYAYQCPYCHKWHLSHGG